MDTLFQTPLTHAYLLPASVFEKAITELESLSTSTSAELLQLEFSRLGVEESHLVQNIATIHSLTDKKYIVISAGDITSDAQHSLLKLLEEPPAGVHFFIFVHQPHTLLATLKSRCVPIGLFLDEERKISKND
jgi:DNA polymerase III delta prime subunit